MTVKSFRQLVYSVAAFIAVIGVGEATYLAVLSLTGATAVCGGAAGCSEVLGSRYARIGNVPIAAVGAISYFIAFSSATFAAFDYRWGERLFSILISLMFVATLWLLYLQAFVLHAFCQYCLFSAALIFFLCGAAVLVPKSSSQR